MSIDDDPVTTLDDLKGDLAGRHKWTPSGGANATDRARLAVTAQYCQPWLRPMEAFTLSVPREVARTVSDDIQRMIGYSIHPPFVGAVDGLHPLRLLDEPR